MADTTTPAVVLKFDPNVMHHGGLGAIRSLGRLGVPVYGVHEVRWAPAAHSRYLTGRFFWRPDPVRAERTREGLIRLAERIGQRAVLIPTDDAGAIFLAEHGAGLAGWFSFAAPAPGLPRRVAGKYSLAELCRDLGVPAPRTSLPRTLAEARGFASVPGYPVIVKLATPWQKPGDKLRSTAIARDERELAELYAACEQAGTAVMLQEFIPPSPGCDWFFHGYCDAASACSPAFTGVKDRSYPAHTGLTSLGHAAANDELRDQVTALLARLRYRGIVDLDFRRDRRDGRYKLLDFNPRLGAQFRLFRDTAGLDVVVAAYLDLTGQRAAAAGQVDQRSFLVENYDPLGAVRYWRAGELGVKSWLGSLRRADELAWFARDDLRPFGLMCARMGWRAVSRRFTRERPASAGNPGWPRYQPAR